jgi:hypothetical protein
MAGAIQPRINKAILSLLGADATLKGLLADLGALVTPADGAPLFWFRAPASVEPPYIVFGPQDTQSTIEPTRCGEFGQGQINYIVELITEGISPEDGLAAMDRVGVLLDGYDASVDNQVINFQAIGDMCYPDFEASEFGVTHTASVYRVLLRP